MPLPKIEHPIVEIYVHSLNRKVKFRPFLVKEERVLMIAKESDDPNEIQTAVQQIVNNCLIDEGVDITTLPLFDVEMIFVKLRAASVGQTIQLSFHCKNEVDGVPCDTDTDYNLDLDKIKYEIPEGHKNIVMLTDKVGIKLKYPTLSSSTADISEEDSDEEIYREVLGTLLDNIDHIFDEESIYKVSDLSKDELIEFIENLTVDKMNNIEAFFATSPRVLLEDKVVCKKCGFEHTLRYEGLASFFM